MTFITVLLAQIVGKLEALSFQVLPKLWQNNGVNNLENKERECKSSLFYYCLILSRL
jgi:hypothetical protein